MYIKSLTYIAHKIRYKNALVCSNIITVSTKKSLDCSMNIAFEISL